MDKSFQNRVKDEFNNQPLKPEELLTEKDLQHLPLCVKKYLLYAGFVNKSKTQNVCIQFDAQMFRKPGDSPLKSNSIQYNFFGDYARLFAMTARKMFLHFSARHIYSKQQASFLVKAAGLFNVVDIKSEELARAETVTFLNDMCLFAPSGLIDKRLSWKEIDSMSCEVTIVNGKYKVSALLFFNETGELVNFVSDDRSALQNDGTMKLSRWSTPVRDYKNFEGRKIPSYGETIWHYPEGDFTYGKFRLKNIMFNLKNYLVQ